MCRKFLSWLLCLTFLGACGAGGLDAVMAQFGQLGPLAVSLCADKLPAKAQACALAQERFGVAWKAVDKARASHAPEDELHAAEAVAAFARAVDALR
jgi:hypothetical protein